MNLRAKKGQKEEHVLNEKIINSEVRVTKSGEGVDGIYRTSVAIKMAKESGLDLIEINPTVNPSVCHIMDYSKFKFEQRKRDKSNKEKSKSKPLKEIKFGPNTGDHDFGFKLKNAETFLGKGHKVKAFVQFKGREMSFREKGELMLLKFAESLGEVGSIEDYPKMNGKKMFMMISPKSKK